MFGFDFHRENLAQLADNTIVKIYNDTYKHFYFPLEDEIRYRLRILSLSSRDGYRYLRSE